MKLQHYIEFRKLNTYLLSNFSFINFFVFGLTMFGFLSQKMTNFIIQHKGFFIQSLSLVSCIHENAKNSAFSPMLHFSACNDLFVRSESSLGFHSSLQKKHLSNKHRFDIADCFPSHIDLTVKCLSQFVTMITDLGNNKPDHFFSLSSIILKCDQSSFPHQKSQPQETNFSY